MAYKDTLYLPKTKFPLWTTRDNGELPYVAKTTDDLYKWQARSNTLIDARPIRSPGRPTVREGSLHMGHALNEILKDTILRFQVLNGRRVQHVPGWDCHGLPIENKALGELGDLKKDPAYGADCSRLWAASVDFGRDMSIGPKVLANTAEAHRNLRNCARFMLANLNDGAETFDPVPRSQMGLAERYLMHEIYGIQKEAHEAYLSHNFPKVVTLLVTFCNATLSAFYFNITKDTLYADSADAQPRRAALTVFEHVLRTMTAIIAPILPHLAEEIHATWKGPHSDLSVFARGWQPLSDEWDDPEVEQDMDELMEVRSLIMCLLEKARAKKLLKSSLEAHVDLVAPEMTQGNQSELLNLLEKHFDELDSLFIVSRVNLIDKADYKPPTDEQWSFTKGVGIPIVHPSRRRNLRLIDWKRLLVVVIVVERVVEPAAAVSALVWLPD
ncbi:anticodon-binding domain of a subclass of class I aminoacyl-tRNA synthetase [Exidia glandulosa HHB12029]|uniref:Anticodon-binding domain of a subclass of class I aminoacyl-tRNA synthetase n=1 Tax=Exidia glandulosa HHB12029 TaxID=1314781 RepID=A0A166AAC9_EXIGL|nr:anticodon-binding domain of a subclass of class I aminoacyl-tRNA synthetase [Exidia glandulosa HHB12029]